MASPLVLPPQLATLLSPLWKALPLDTAMAVLVVDQPAHSEHVRLVRQLVSDKLLASCPPLVAALWLYVDDLDASHKVSQSIDDDTGAFWHGIMHRREGDFSNSHYWFRRVGEHPAMKLISGYDGHHFIDEVEAARSKGESPAPLIEMQRREWSTLFAWCAAL